MEVNEREQGKITVENAYTKVESLITEEFKVNVLNSRMVLAYTPCIGTVSLSLRQKFHFYENRWVRRKAGTNGLNTMSMEYPC